MPNTGLTFRKRTFAYRVLPLAMFAIVVIGRAMNFFAPEDGYFTSLNPLTALGFLVLAFAMARGGQGLGNSRLLQLISLCMVGISIQRLLEIFVPGWPFLLRPQIMVDYWFVPYAPERMSALCASGLITLHIALLTETRWRHVAVAFTFAAFCSAIFFINALTVDTAFLPIRLSGFSALLTVLGAVSMALRLGGKRPFNVFFKRNALGLGLCVGAFVIASEPFWLGLVAAQFNPTDYALAAAVSQTICAIAVVKLSALLWLSSTIDSNQEKLLRAADIDHLTGLLNRHGLARQRLDTTYRGVVMLDIDNFKPLNDALGHVAGDRLLVAVSKALSDCLSEAETLVRWGGDEFMVLSEDWCPGHLYSLSERLRKAVATLPPVAAEQGLHALTISVGYALIDAVTKGFDGAVSRADQALYAAKQAGRNQAFSEQGAIDSAPGVVGEKSTLSSH
jgi:diguanylate cyclase (GGDEF)-like protein